MTTFLKSCMNAPVTLTHVTQKNVLRKFLPPPPTMVYVSHYPRSAASPSHRGVNRFRVGARRLSPPFRKRLHYRQAVHRNSSRECLERASHDPVACLHLHLQLFYPLMIKPTSNQNHGTFAVLPCRLISHSSLWSIPDFPRATALAIIFVVLFIDRSEVWTPILGASSDKSKKPIKRLAFFSFSIA